MSPTLSRADRSRNRLRRLLLAVTTLAGTWLLTAGALLLATPTLEILAWQPMHRGDYEGAELFLRAGVALTRVGTWIHVPGQRLHLAASLGDLAEARERRVPAEAERLYLESIAIYEDELGPNDSQARFARYRYRSFLRSTEPVDDRSGC